MYAFRTALRPIGLFLPEFATLQRSLSAIADLLVCSRNWNYTLSQKKLCQYYFLNNSVPRWPILIIFGTQHHEGEAIGEKTPINFRGRGWLLFVLHSACVCNLWHMMYPSIYCWPIGSSFLKQLPSAVLAWLLFFMNITSSSAIAESYL